MSNIQKYKTKLQLWLNANVWPFSRISDLVSDLDQARYDRDAMERHLFNYMREDIREMDLRTLRPDRRNPVRVTAFNGHNISNRTLFDGPNNVEKVEVITLEPRVRNVAYDKTMYPNYETDPVIKEQYARMLADHVSQATWEDVVKEIMNDRT